MSLSERLKLAMKNSGFTQASLAHAVGMAQSSVWKLVSGEAVSSRRLVDIARVLGVDAEWLQHGSTSETTKNKVLPSFEAMTKKHIELPINKGTKVTNNQFLIPISIYKSSLKAYEIESDTGINEITKGSIVVVDPKEPPSQNDLVLVKINKNISAYRYIKNAGNDYLSADDPRIPLVTVDDKINLLGVIILLSKQYK
ncbi:TPA: helix-turn-helix domain-containing protein [Morganella morganii]|uniref:helix-turn-helix domain-containing protein n=1 Tax=Enterobacterales TaxID=91347 RepID=UPI001A3597F3|nr:MULTISPECIES: helix-turn-helix domain-containing protein [Enterobacterales]MCU6211019.1 helix-turn-helix domain-containing protein [Morganella morganii]HAT1515391.1 helix-turn-helix domain-containing protein [Morganella morganii]